MGNSVVFPAPEEHTIPSKMRNVLYFHSKSRDDETASTLSRVPGFCCSGRKTPRKIPFLYFKEETEPSRSQYLLIYFHGNSEVLSNTYKTLKKLHSSLRISILSPEYPGYGLYDTEAPSEENILDNADVMIRYSINSIHYKEENIILVGKAFGTGVVAKMGIMFPNLRGIVMLSPYLSIREVVKNMVGGTLSKVIPNIFRTKEIMPDLKPPVLLVHGLKDPIVPCTNSSYLYYSCNAPKMLIFSVTMDHNKSDFRSDLYLPILKFFVEKLGMREFLEQYNDEETDKLPALSSLEDSKVKVSKKSSVTNRNYNSQSTSETLNTDESKND